jgi:type IV secretory pathway VirB9-like protein
MMRRRGRPLLRAAATTAVIAGTAGAVHHRQEQRWENQSAQQQAEQDAAYAEGAAGQQAAAAQQAAAQQAAASQAAATRPRLDEELRQLGDLHTSGVLTDEEFATAKAQLLRDA